MLLIPRLSLRHERGSYKSVLFRKREIIRGGRDVETQSFIRSLAGSIRFYGGSILCAFLNDKLAIGNIEAFIPAKMCLEMIWIEGGEGAGVSSDTSMSWTW